MAIRELHLLKLSTQNSFSRTLGVTITTKFRTGLLAERKREGKGLRPLGKEHISGGQASAQRSYYATGSSPLRILCCWEGSWMGEDTEVTSQWGARQRELFAEDAEESSGAV